jgi:hypothetical protein
MRLTKFGFSPLSIVTVVALAFVVLAGFTFMPSGTVEACNPCNCKEDLRDNCQGIEFYGVYTRVIGGQCVIDAYRMSDSGPGRRVFRVTERELARLPEFPESNLLVRENDAVALYKLTTGEYQINAGPDLNNKVYVIIFTGCPSNSRQESSFEVQRPS